MKGNLMTICIIKSILLLFFIPNYSRSEERTILQDTTVNVGILPYGPGFADAPRNQVITTIYPYGSYDIDMYSPKYMHVTGTYLDGFGNPRLEVDLKSTPNFKNTVSFHRYEPASQKVSTAYLPFVHGDTDLQDIYTDIEQKQHDYYTTPPTDVVPNPYPFSQTEAGLSNIQQGGIGAEWQLYNAAIPNSGHTNRIDTRVIRDTDPGFVRWKLTSTGIAPDTDTVLYDDDRIVKQIFKGPNWVSGKTGITENFTDQYGRLRLQRSYLDESIYAETAYIYDIYDRLRAVAPPGTPYQTINEGDSIFEKHLYIYRYNTIGQLSAIKFPQQGWAYTVYDRLDRPVLTQDALQREQGIWAFVKYDKIGRSVISGVYTSSMTQQQLQDSVDASPFFFEERNLSSPTGYTYRVFPTSGLTEYNISYFDSYDHIPLGNPWDTTGEEHTLLTMGLPVASKSRILGTDDFLWSTVFYDSDHRPKVRYSQNYMGGYTKTANTYDYAGLLLSSRTEHRTSVDSFAVNSRYEYDHRGRLLKEYVQVDGQQELIKTALDYNELGQIIQTRIHSSDSGQNYLQSQRYSYDKTGTFKGINDIDSTDINRLFAYRLLYEDASEPRYDGNIAAQKWKVHGSEMAGGRIPDSLAYTYDGLERLKTVNTSSGGVATGDYDERFAYDIRGNITALSRYAEISGTRTRIDSLRYTYDHDRHTRIDNVAGVPGVGFTELSQANDEYRYNTNGMLVADDNKGITAISYNAFGLIDTVIWANGNRLVYTYTGAGERIRRKFLSGANTLTKHYVDGVQYSSVNGDSSTFDFAQLSGARLRRSADTLRFEYDLTDHLGNTRVTFDEDPLNPCQPRILQYNSYYAFGDTMPGPGLEFVSGQKNSYLYNGKELQEETGLYDYGFRMYDVAIGRWHAVDPLAANHYDLSAYQYVMNSPLRYIDPLGIDTIDISGGKKYNGKIRVGDYISYGSGEGLTVTQQWLQENFGGGVAYYIYGDELALYGPGKGSSTYTGSSYLYHSSPVEQMLRSLGAQSSSGTWETQEAARKRKEAEDKAVAAEEERLARELAAKIKAITPERSKMIFSENSSDQNEATNLVMASRGGVPAIIVTAGYLYYNWWRDNGSEIDPSLSTMAPTLGGLLTHYLMSKGGPRNIWPDQYGYPPNVNDIDWGRSDGQLADELSKAFGDDKKGQGTPNNHARKWFRDKRPK